MQHVQWRHLRAKDSAAGAGANTTPDFISLVRAEGPKYQYGRGCLADGVLGLWLAKMSGLDVECDHQLVSSHVRSVFRHNFRYTLREHVNPQRLGYAFGDEAGLLLCTWPKRDEPTLPFPYSHEAWTGIEYQVASHLILLGEVKDGLRIVEAARQRYDGRRRNPFCEYECGLWYGRALSSYALLQAVSGARYDAVERKLYLAPKVAGDCRFPLCTENGWGRVGIHTGEPFCDVEEGEIPISAIIYDRSAAMDQA